MSASGRLLSLIRKRGYAVRKAHPEIPSEIKNDITNTKANPRRNPFLLREATNMHKMRTIWNLNRPQPSQQPAVKLRPRLSATTASVITKQEQQRILTLQKTNQHGREQQEQGQQNAPVKAVKNMPLKDDRGVRQDPCVKRHQIRYPFSATRGRWAEIAVSQMEGGCSTRQMRPA